MRVILFVVFLIGLIGLYVFMFDRDTPFQSPKGKKEVVPKTSAAWLRQHLEASNEQVPVKPLGAPQKGFMNEAEVANSLKEEGFTVTKKEDSYTATKSTTSTYLGEHIKYSEQIETQIEISPGAKITWSTRP